MLVGTVVHGLDETARNAWARDEAYIALGNLVNSAALLGIDVCPMEGFDRAQYDDILGLKAEGFASAVIATLGYGLPTDKCADAAKLRFPNEAKLVALVSFSQTNQRVGAHRHLLKTTTLMPSGFCARLVPPQTFK